MDCSRTFPLLVEKTESCCPLWCKDEGAALSPRVWKFWESPDSNGQTWAVPWSNSWEIIQKERDAQLLLRKVLQQRPRKFGAVFLPFQGTPGCPSWAVPLCHILCRAGVTNTLLV